jgi:hypothetical protein
MSLSLGSYENRMWKNYSGLRHFLSRKKAHPKHDRFSTATSITDTNFDREKRFQDVLALIRSYGAELPEGPFSTVDPISKDKSPDIANDLEHAARDAEMWTEYHRHEATLLINASKELRELSYKMKEWQKREEREKVVVEELEKKERVKHFEAKKPKA